FRRSVDELEVGVGDDGLLEVGVDAGTAAAVAPREFELDPRAVVLLPLDLVLLEDVGLVLSGVDAKLDFARLAPLARLREDDDRLARRKHRVKAGGADADALLPARLLQAVKFRPVEELGENLRDLLLDDARTIVLDADAEAVLADLGDVDVD